MKFAGSRMEKFLCENARIEIAEGGLEFNGISYLPQPELAYVSYVFCHSWPTVNSKGRTLSAKTIANSFPTIRHQLLNFRHLMTDSFPKLDHDYVIGHIIDARFPVEEYQAKGILRDDLTIAEGATEGVPLYVLGCLFKRVKEVGGKNGILDQHLSGKARWMTSMETDRALASDALVYDGQIIPVTELSREMAECIKSDSMQPYQGKPTALMVAGADGHGRFVGSGFTLYPADREAKIVRMVASMDFYAPEEERKKVWSFIRGMEAAGRQESVGDSGNSIVEGGEQEVKKLLEKIYTNLKAIEASEEFKQFKEANTMISEARQSIFLIMDKMDSMIRATAEQQAEQRAEIIVKERTATLIPREEAEKEKKAAVEVAEKAASEKAVAEAKVKWDADLAEEKRREATLAGFVGELQKAGLAAVPDGLKAHLKELAAKESAVATAEFKVALDRWAGRVEQVKKAGIETSDAIKHKIAVSLAEADDAFKAEVDLWKAIAKPTRETAERKSAFIPVGGGNSTGTAGKPVCW